MSKPKPKPNPKRVSMKAWAIYATSRTTIPIDTYHGGLTLAQVEEVAKHYPGGIIRPVTISYTKEPKREKK